MKKILPHIALMLIASSCKKDYSCDCIDTPAVLFFQGTASNPQLAGRYNATVKAHVPLRHYTKRKANLTCINMEGQNSSPEVYFETYDSVLSYTLGGCIVH